MASITTRPNGHHWIQFMGPSGKRQTLYLKGKTTERYAQDFRRYVEDLLTAKLAGSSPKESTARWLGDLTPYYYERLVRCGLVDSVGAKVNTIGGLLKDFVSSLSVAKSTMENNKAVLNNIRTHFGEDCRLGIITTADASVFRGWLKAHGGQYGGPLAKATVSRRTRRAKQIFEHAVDQGWLAANPFAKQKGWDEVNRGKDFYVTREIIGQILDEVTNLEFRAIIALARFGGLRCPKEVLSLEWDAVSWDHKTLSAYASKTDTHRIVPLFPELDKALGDLFEAAADGATKLFPRHQMTGTGLKSELERACRRAGVPLWQKPWQNMRSTRVTELQGEFHVRAVADWMGHSPTTALKHYSQVVKDQFARAVASEACENVKLRKSELYVPQKR